MITSLRIKNIALIKSLEIDLSEGLNILSGETGAGKSIIIDSLNFVLGERADKSLIRYGEDVAEVEAIFWTKGNQELVKILDEFGIEVEDDTLILRRSMNVSGRSDIRINGRAVTAQMLKSITQYLCDIHGQHEHQSLLRSATHLNILDKFGDKEISECKNALKDVYYEYKDVCQKLGAFGDDSARAREIDMLEYAVAEIDRMELYDGIDEEIASIRKKLQNTERLAESVRGAENSLSSAEDVIYRAYSSICSVEKYDEELSDFASRLESARIEIRDISESLSSIADGYVYSVDYADAIESKYDTIKSLKRKYGPELQDVLAYRESAGVRLDELKNSEMVIEQLEKKKTVLSSKLSEKARDLSLKRQTIAKKLEKLISVELAELGMKGTVFAVNFADFGEKITVDMVTENGADQVEFLISPNKGEPLKSLSKIISGGEMSRFMLALKVIFAKLDGIGTLVFDEIDTGISGVIAYEVAKKLYKISRDAQVIAVTHLPQLAAAADSSFLIEKRVVSDTTVTSVYPLDKDGKLSEVARLSGGLDASINSVLHAKELVDKFEVYKKSF